MKVIREIERLLRTFLWGSPRKARIKWLDLCKPKEAGGLGIPNLYLTNKAYLIKQIWFIYEDRESLWAKWVHSVLLKEPSIWPATLKQLDS